MPDLATMRGAIRAWVERAEHDPRCKALWLEGPSPAAIRRHDGPVDLHLGVEDPDFGALQLELATFLSAAGTVRRHADGPAEPDAFATVADVTGLGTVTCTLERMSLLGKRPRVAVQPVFDRTGRLRHVLDYSGARPSAPSKEAAVARHPDVLDDAVIAAALSRLTPWKRQGNEIIASYRLPSFLAAVTLLGQVALAAEHADHHPDMLVRYQEVSFSLTTHDAKGLTQRDLDLAARIQGLAEEILAGRAPKSSATAAAKKKPKKSTKKAPAKQKPKTRAKKAPAKQKPKTRAKKAPAKQKPAKKK